MMIRKIVALAALNMAIMCSSPVIGALEYPATETIDHIDTYHGVQVSDPYRWLEEDVRQSQRVRDWVQKQNEVTFRYLRSLPGRDDLQKRLTALWNYEKYSSPWKIGGRYYISKNDGLQNHFVIYTMDALDGPRRVLLDPNKWSADGTVALGGLHFSEDGRYVVYGIQDSGSDWRTWKVREIATGEDLPDTLKNLKFTEAAWDPDSKGFFYARYPDPDPAATFTALNRDMKVMYHRLGARQQDDVVVFYRPDHPEWSYQLQTTDDGRYLIIAVWVGTDPRYRILYKDLRQPYAMPVDLIDEFTQEYNFIDNDGPVFYFQTDLDAPNKRIITIDIRDPGKDKWKTVIPESPEPLQRANLVGNRLICTYLKDVATEVRLFALDGRSLGAIPLPGPGSAGGFGGKRTDTETFYRFESYSTPPSVYRYDLNTGQSKLIERAKIDFDPDQYVTTQVFYESKDGTRVPMFITRLKSIPLDGSAPTLLYGYGGFNGTIAPGFSALRLAWMEKGGIYAVANIRGGGEYGRKWHEGGKKMNKRNCFDDFIAAAEYLIRNKYTSSKKLAINGGSNGGLLVGACLTQRPDLFGAAVPAVGVMDMLRFDAFTAGRFWVDDYGSASDSREMFEYLRGYSPYHNLKEGVSYPATLITTADTDDRVVPGHSFKFAARIQKCQSGDRPVLIRIETRAGHGSGRPTSMIIDEQADIYAFLMANLGFNSQKTN